MDLLREGLDPFGIGLSTTDLDRVFLLWNESTVALHLADQVSR
jgi:hypothetical protein